MSLVAAARRPDLREFGWRPRWPRLHRIDATHAYRPHHHADRVPPTGDGEAWMDAARYVARQRRQAMEAPDARRAVAALGRALHAAQDMVSHSNIAEMARADRRESLQALRQATPAPAGLRLTSYAPGARQPSAPDDAYPHAAYAKDHPRHNDASKRRVGRKTAYDAAHAAAVDVSVDILRDFLACRPRTLPRRRWPWLAVALGTAGVAALLALSTGPGAER